MKEAAGEANMTVITIILIGVIAAVAIPIVNSAMKSTKAKACCTNVSGSWVGGKCDKATDKEYTDCMSATK
ncbi:MAG: hypothetical protein RSB71_00325 [Bacilli bacterium]